MGNKHEEIAQTIARGYCYSKNSKKILDPDLVAAIAEEIERWYLAEEDNQSLEHQKELEIITKERDAEIKRAREAEKKLTESGGVSYAMDLSDKSIAILKQELEAKDKKIERLNQVIEGQSRIGRSMTESMNIAFKAAQAPDCKDKRIEDLEKALQGIVLAYERKGKDLEHTLWCIWRSAKEALSPAQAKDGKP